MTKPCPICGQPYNGHEGIFIDERLRDIIVDGEYIRLTTREMQVFAGIVKSAPRTVTTNYLMDYIYGLETDNEPQKKIVHVYVCRIRKLIKHTRFRIDTVRGLGYKLVKKDIVDGSENQIN